MGHRYGYRGAAAALAVFAVTGGGCTGVPARTPMAAGSAPVSAPVSRSPRPTPTVSRIAPVPAVTTDAALPPAGPVAPAQVPRTVVWSREDVNGPVAVVHGTVLAGTTIGYQSGVADWDARTGRLRWRQFDPAAFPMQTVATASSVVAVLGSPDIDSVARQTLPRVIHAFDLASGRLVWTRPVPQHNNPAGPNSQLVVTGDTVAIAEGASTVTDVDARTGRTRWSSPGAGTCTMSAGADPDRDYPGPLVADASTTVIARSCGQTAVDALDSKTGAPRWSWPAADSGLRAPRGAAVAGIADGVVFVSAVTTGRPAATEVVSVLDRHAIQATPLLALDARTGALLWSEPGALIGTVVADGSHAACLMSSGGYECRDARAGRLLFTPIEFDPGTAVYGNAFNAVPAYPYLYELVPVGGDRVRFTTRDATTGRLLAGDVLPGWKWTVQANGYHPAVVAAGAGILLLQRIDTDPQLPLVAYR